MDRSYLSSLDFIMMVPAQPRNLLDNVGKALAN